MDLTRPVTYRNFNLNTPSVASGLLAGCQIDDADLHAVESVGYREKRSLSDGIDSSDIYLGARYVSLKGTLYGASRAELFDKMNLLRTALLPTSAYAESPATLGYLPLGFDEPTVDTVTWPTGYITKVVNVRPLSTPFMRLNRDHIGGASGKGFSIPWECQFEARDPRIYYATAITTYFNAAGNTSSGSGSVTNRGPYPAPLNILVFVPGGANTDRVLTFTFAGGITKITIPTSANDRTARYNGVEKYLTIEEQGVEVLRMDMLEFTGAITHPLVPNGVNAHSWTYKNIAGTNQNINAASRFWFTEAWA